MQRLITLASFVLALLLFTGAAETAQAAPYDAFCKGGISSNTDLATRLENALTNDSTGQRAKVVGCQANALQFVTAFQKAAPEEGVTLANLVQFVREGLREEALTEDITFYSSCVKGRSSGPEDVLMRCQIQTLKAGTHVLVSVKTGKKLVKKDCGNVGFTSLVPNPCAYVLVRVKEDGFIEAGAFGNVTPEEESSCPIGVQGPVATGGRFPEGAFRSLTEMQDHPCDWWRVKRVLGLPLHVSGCIRVAPGWYAYRVPLRFATDAALRMVFCLTEDNGRTTLGMGVEPNEYHGKKGGKQVATVWYSEEDALKFGHHKTILWWRFKNH